MNILNTSSLNYVGDFIQRWHKTALYTCYCTSCYFQQCYKQLASQNEWNIYIANV